MRCTTTIARYLLVSLSLLALSAPVRAASPMIQGWAWIDQNCDGIRQDAEPSAKQRFALYLYRFGADGMPFTSDDKLLRIIPAGIEAGTYRDTTDSAIMPAE